MNAPIKQPNRVEVFLFKPKELKLIHQYTVEDPAFTRYIQINVTRFSFSLSDIVVFNAGRFLVSNVFRWSNKWLRLAEFMTQREYGSLQMYDGKQVVSLIRYHPHYFGRESHICFSGLQTPNGLFWDQNSRRLYVSLTNAEVSPQPFYRQLTPLRLSKSIT